jgi:uncharacterized membrane protein
MKFVPGSAENNLSKKRGLFERRQAFWVWSLVASAALLWALLITLPPFLAAFEYTKPALPIYSFFSYICHQIPDRSLHLLGHQLGVCSRCFGVYAGLFIGIAVYPLWRSVENINPLPRKWLLLSIVPMGIDWSLTIFDIWENNHASRFITGLILGAACSIYILPALVEIFRNFTLAKRSAD